MSLLDEILADALPEPLKDFFGDSATYTHKPGGTTDTVTVIPSDPSPTEAAYPGSTTLIDVLIADLSIAATQGDEVVIGSSTFVVIDVKTDTIGPSGLFVRLALRKKP